MEPSSPSPGSSSQRLALSLEEILQLHADELQIKMPKMKQKTSRFLLFLTLATLLANIALAFLHNTDNELQLQTQIQDAYKRMREQQDMLNRYAEEQTALIPRREEQKQQIAELTAAVEQLRSRQADARQKLEDKKAAEAEIKQQLLHYIAVQLQARSMGITQVLYLTLSPELAERETIIQTLHREWKEQPSRQYELESVALNGDLVEIIYSYSGHNGSTSGRGHMSEQWQLNKQGLIIRWERTISSIKPAHSTGFRPIN